MHPSNGSGSSGRAYAVPTYSSTCIIQTSVCLVFLNNYSGVTVVSQWSYIVVTLLLHCCPTSVTLLLHRSYTVLTLLFHCCSTLLQCCYSVVAVLSARSV
jgi:hypothetical protein